ncbi:MAG: hypothetical protein WBD20_16380 [Pirellulaceae bacterium]
MARFAVQYPAKATLDEAIVQDFHTFRQALNVASADQRVLVVINTNGDQKTHLRDSLKSVVNDSRIVGRFHFDFETSDDWKQNVSGTTDQPGIVVINPGEFGLTGKVMTQLPLDAKPEQITDELLKANDVYAKTTKKKVYSEHVAKGRKAGVYFEGAVPYGEDRDGDGEIDHRGGSQRRQ